jgi:cysteine-rich repeat protein
MPMNKLSWILLAAVLTQPACKSDNNGQGGAGSKSNDAEPGGAGGHSSAAGQGGSGDQSGTAPAAPAGLGAPCRSDADCAGSFCLGEGDTGWPGGFCSASCDVSQPTCQGAGKCFDTGQTMGLCVLPCTAEGSECRSGYACSDAVGDGSLLICLPACTADEQCSVLGSCDTTRRFCVAPEVDCSNGEDDDGDGLIDCEDPKSCQGSPACASGATLTGHPCTSNADCAAAGGDPACISEAGFGFPHGSCSEFCELSTNDCGSANAVCVDRQLPSGHGMCFPSCTTAADCPTAGYQCASAGGGKKACLPACAADSQCSTFCNLDNGLCAASDESCADAMDNDVDGRVDCEDLDCAATCGSQLTMACGSAIAAQASTQSDTTTGFTNLFSGSCTGMGANEKVFTFTPGAAGQVGALQLTLKSATDQGIYVRSACGDSVSEIGCADQKPGGQDETLTVPVTGGVPVSIFVDSYKAGNTGPFTLSAAFEQAICSDGKRTVPEECDDGNSTAGDGCDAACHGEPAFYCASAAPASDGMSQGDTAGGSSSFKGSCTGAGALERIYTYTPSKNGTLHVMLNSTTQQGVYIRASCADAASEIACADAAFMGAATTLDVPVTGGVPLTIFVDGHEAGSQAPFSLMLSLP